MRFFTSLFLSLILAITPILASAQVGMSSVATPTGAYSYSRISTNATTVVKSGYGTLHSITVNSVGGSPSTITVYDNTAASGTIIAVIDGDIGVNSYIYDIAFNTGLTVVTNSTTTFADLTVSYK